MSAAEPVPAASVVLVRDGTRGIEAWLMRRVKAMSFAAGMTVFPGGRVDQGDAETIGWSGGGPAFFAAAFDCTAEQARLTVVAAVRETFEETGVLLTDPPASDPRAEDRRAVEDREVSFAGLLSSTGLGIDAAALHPWARWVTPPSEPRRYDTFFYLAVMPVGARAITGTTEAVHADWLRPAQALAEFAVGERPLMPPTVIMLRELSTFATTADAVAAACGRSVVTVRPRLEFDAHGARIVTMPDGTVHTVGPRA